MSTDRDIEVDLQKRLSPLPRNSTAEGHLNHIPHIVCADGLKMSVQASRYHYCQPRDNSGPWYLVEVSFPSRKVEELMPYIDGEDSDPTETVYGYVPLTVVAVIIQKAGGFAKGSAA